MNLRNLIYWRRAGYEDAILGDRPKSFQFFAGAQMTWAHGDYMSGYRCGQDSLREPQFSNTKSPDKRRN